MSNCERPKPVQKERIAQQTPSVRETVGRAVSKVIATKNTQDNRGTEAIKALTEMIAANPDALQELKKSQLD